MQMLLGKVAKKTKYLINKYFFVRRAIQAINNLPDSEKEKYHEEIEWLNRNRGGAMHQIVYQYTWADKYARKTPVYKNEGFYYVIDDYNGQKRKLYFTRDKWISSLVRRNYNFMCLEQDEKSPHSYLADDFQVPKDGILFDIGAADGMFTLRHIEKVKHAYILECDDNWIEALKKTFNPYKEKITIIKKYVGDKDDECTITLNTLFNKSDVNRKEKIFLKMDIEGAELRTLKKAKKALNDYSEVLIAVCVYHRPSDYQDVRALFNIKEWQISETPGYMLVNMYGFESPYYRKGVLHIKRMKE